jgi:hypothetical protein
MPISKTRLAEIAAIADEDIDTSDIPEAGEHAFKQARLKLPADQADAGTGANPAAIAAKRVIPPTKP